jgi:hypothetical protein
MDEEKFEKIKTILINYLKEDNKMISVDNLESKILNNKSFFNRNSNLLESHFRKNKSEFICGNPQFICFKSGVLLIESKNNVLRSKGFYQNHDFIPSGFLDHLLKIDEKLKVMLTPFTPEGEKIRLKEIEKQRLNELQISQNNVLSELDKDGNGEVDVVEGNDFNLLLKNHQKQIIEFGRNDNKNYVQQFIQLKNYLNTQKKNVQHVFDSIKDISNQTLLDEYVKVLKNNIHSYEVLLVHSLNMISVLVEDDLFTFYDIYEKLDKLNIFNSNYQNEMLDRLSEIEDRLEEIIYSIEDMSISIVSGLDSLTEEIGYSTKLLSENLNSIESSIDLNTLVTGIGSYQMYKINKNIKSLN